jgi:hypothetical protein
VSWIRTVFPFCILYQKKMEGNGLEIGFQAMTLAAKGACTTQKKWGGLFDLIKTDSFFDSKAMGALIIYSNSNRQIR